MHQHPEPNTTPTAEGLEVVDATGIITGNADIVCERGEPQPDTVACTLPIYPQPGDLPPDPPANMSTPRQGAKSVAFVFGDEVRMVCGECAESLGHGAAKTSERQSLSRESWEKHRAEVLRVDRTVAPLEAITRDIDAMVARVHHDFPKSAPGPHTRRVGDREGDEA